MISIQSVFHEYHAEIVSDREVFLAANAFPESMIVADRKVFDLYPDLFADLPTDRLILIDALETNKTIETALSICERMSAMPAKRNARLTSFGGGIIQDITGFAANILYRGIHWTFIPTTLLAACDSCIGGKTSLNYLHYKNLLGTFFPPQKILINTNFFQTLSEADFLSGLGEVVKFNIMAGTPGMDFIEKNLPDLLSRDPDTLRSVVDRSLRYKKKYIEADEFDRGERLKLNFAHTFGHAIETLSEYVIPHGTAVAVGMIMADRVSERRGILHRATRERSERLLLSILPNGMNFSMANQADRFIMAMRKDKKQTGVGITAALRSDGEENLRIVHDLSEEEIRAVLLDAESLIRK